MISQKAVVVLSGGLDSSTCLGLAHAEGYQLYALTFHYGQRHNREVEQAKKIAQFYQVKEHRLVTLELFTGNRGQFINRHSPRRA